MSPSARRVCMLAAFLGCAPIGSALPAHTRETDRLFAHARQSEKKGDYWQALRDVEAVLKADPEWREAQVFRRSVAYEAHWREAQRLIDVGDWKEAANQLENARLYNDSPMIAAKLRQVRAQLRQDQPSPAPTDGRLEAARRQARDALQRNDLEAARVSLRECLALSPSDPAIHGQLDALELRIANAAAYRTYLDSAVHALEVSDWTSADRRIRGLPSAPVPDVPLDHDDLLPAFRLYAATHSEDARRAARGLADPAAHSFLLFLNAGLRRDAVPLGIRLGVPLYLAALLGSLYFGLLREARRRHP